MSFNRSASGSLFREILGFEEAEDTVLVDTEICQPFDVVGGSTDDDTRSSEGSESDDPIHDDTLLQDLFYVNKVYIFLELSSSSWHDLWEFSAVWT